MPNLTPLSPLLQPVVWQGQDYYASQYFHQQYLAQSQQAGKYKRLDSFMRLLRSIEAYQEYLTQGDIVELRWSLVKTEQPQICGCFQDLFQAAGWQPLTLLNATAQVALSHHLDDELSKQLSVTANTAIARQEKGPALLDQYPELKAITEMARSVVALAHSTAEARAVADAARLIAETAQQEAQEAKQDAAQAHAKVDHVIDQQQRFTVAEYVKFEHLGAKIPESAYKALSDHLRLYCLDHNMPFRRVPIGGKPWNEEYEYHRMIFDAALPGWLRRRYAQTELRILEGGAHAV